MRRLIISTLLLVGVAGLLFIPALHLTGVSAMKGHLEYYTCPLLKYPVVGTGNKIEQRYREWKHDINGDGKADIVALYVYSKTLKRWVELDRKYIGGVDA